MKPRHLLSTLVAVFALGAGSAAFAASNDDCLKCHGDQAQPATGGKPASRVDAAKFKASAHGASRTKCVECHEDAPAGREHPEKLQPVNCSNCHEDAVQTYGKTVHGKSRGGQPLAATCRDCHGHPHEALVSSDPASRTNHANIEATCGSCHGDDRLVEKAHLHGGNVVAKYHDSIHGRLLHSADARVSGRAPTCNDCHGSHTILSHEDRDSQVSPSHLPQTCGGCHQRALVAYQKGKHGELQQAGKTSAPGCADCHTAHAIEQTSKPQWQVAVIGQCGNCHDEYITSYRKTYHGKVTDLGYAGIATCASCHGAHDIRPASDPLSTVSARNRAQTCRHCHKEASDRFASWDPHPRPDDRERSSVLWVTNIAMNGLLWGVFGFFGLHTVLWGYRSVADLLKRRRGGPGR